MYNKIQEKAAKSKSTHDIFVNNVYENSLSDDFRVTHRNNSPAVTQLRQMQRNDQASKTPIWSKPNTTGIPTQIKQEFEQKSGFAFDDVNVHYNSDKPEQVQALAFTQGSEVHIAPGQEKHLRHELGHVVQQKQGIVKPCIRIGDYQINDEKHLEQEAEWNNLQPHSPIYQSPSMVGKRIDVIQCFKVHEDMPYIPPHLRTGPKRDPDVLWDSDWTDETKKEKIKSLDSKQMDSVFLKIRGLISAEPTALSEIEKIVKLYNKTNNSLPQSKTMDDAPSTLAFSSSSPIKDAMEAISKDKGFDVCCSEELSVFLEDTMEGLRTQYIGTRVNMGINVYQHILEGRETRWGKEKYIPDAEVGDRAIHGEQARDNAEKLTKKHVYLLCPIEGGNMLTGNDFVIIGKDSLYATMGLYKVDEGIAKAMIGDDYGIKSEKVYPIEQPGEYHLDMAMTLVKNDTILIKTPPDDKHLINQTIKDLQSFGFTIVQDDGKAIGPTFNFLNGEFVKSKDQKIYYLTNEPDISNKDSEQTKGSFKEFFKSKFPTIQDVLFVPNALSLQDKGGLGCRVKGIPEQTIPEHIIQ